MKRIAAAAQLLLCLALPEAFAASEPAIDAARSRILAMFDRDQSVRRDLRLYQADRENRDSGKFTQVIESIRRADRQNQAEFEAIIVQHGWPDKARFGALVSSRAFVIALHTDAQFQLKHFPMFKKLAEAGELPASSIAVMEDRILMRQSRLQKYGSQTDVSDGLTIHRTEDEANLDARRKAVGLAPICMYLQRFTREYGPVTYQPCKPK